jgi:O-acetyl-ADP-ribose deacetylase (regulator of RNase III)
VSTLIENATGDLLSASVDALVNPVNTVGVMGKGLALAFKKRFPESFAAYRAADVVIGKMFVFERPVAPRWIINFPTKRHWRDANRLEDIRAGLVDLVEQLRQNEVSSVAVPALGCGLGGLEWKDVRPMIVDACKALPTVRVLLFAPR